MTTALERVLVELRDATRESNRLLGVLVEHLPVLQEASHDVGVRTHLREKREKVRAAAEAAVHTLRHGAGT